MLPSLSSPVIFAHRGASSHAPENTLAAFQLAIDQNATAIELDVQLTKDKEVIVFHDVFLDRTTDGKGKTKSLSLSEIKQLNAGFPASPAYQKETIPTLAEVLSFLPQEIFINIELKNLDSSRDELPTRTLSVIHEYNAQSRVLLSSFNTIALQRSYKKSPDVPLGLLVRTSLFADIHLNFPYILNKIQSIHLSYKALTPRLVASFKQAEKKVFTYTLNHTSDIVNAMNMGVDGFFTDDPGFARRILSQEGYI
jgi:glycerophosphoryl diester phosphodiesterase